LQKGNPKEGKVPTVKIEYRQLMNSIFCQFNNFIQPEILIWAIDKGHSTIQRGS